MPNLPSLGQIIGYIIAADIVILLLNLLLFLLIRGFICWYFKINERLREQEQTNELLQNIFDALIQGNTVNAVTASELVNMEDKRGILANLRDSDIPDL